MDAPLWRILYLRGFAAQDFDKLLICLSPQNKSIRAALAGRMVESLLFAGLSSP